MLPTFCLFPVLWHCVCSLGSKNQIEIGLTPDQSASVELFKVLSPLGRKTRYPCLLCIFVWGTIGEQLFPNKVISPRIRSHRPM